jgi:hypothetical protein
VNTQDLFNSTIGQLDHVLSLLVLHAKKGDLDEANRQTLKHHAEDMIAAGQCILGKLGAAQEGLPQPAAKREPKIGDRVRAFTRHASEWANDRTGRLDEIEDDGSDQQYLVAIDDADGEGHGTNRDQWWCTRVEVID